MNDNTDQPSSNQESGQLWECLNILISALNAKNQEAALRTVLKVGGNLTGANVLAVYLAQGSQPAFRSLVSSGPAGALPEELAAQDMVYLSKPRLWQSGKRPACSLYNSARAARLSYLTSAPIGEDKAIIGQIVVADHQPLSNPDILGITRSLAASVYAIIQQDSWRSYMSTLVAEQAGFHRFGEALEEYSREGILALDPDLRILRINTAAELALGYTRREVIAQPVEKVLIGPEALVPALVSAQAGSPTYNLGDVRLYRRDGNAFPALVRIFPVMEGERVEELIVFIQDLSEQEQIGLQVQQLEQRAFLGEVTAIFAHEVRNPINNISTGLQLLSMNLPEEDPLQEQVGRMLQDCDRLAELMKSVLAFSKPVEYAMEKLDLPALLRRLIERFQPRIARLNVHCDLKIEPLCPEVLGNLRALEQVFGNLITNALQAMKDNGGNLVVRVQPIPSLEGKGYVEVSVADTGPGIPPELQERIFQPFFSLQSGGTGLGLAIAKRIVTAHKGNIRLTSFPGGTIFYVQLPVVEG